MARMRAQTPNAGKADAAVAYPTAPLNPREKPGKGRSYASDGVEDNDVFLLPVSDYKIMLAITLLAAAVRLFRIYQPTSVVFDEVQ